ncbi:Protein SMAX1-LIKE 5 [Dichanthelium oligosanthes]|uniref:Protein SMAX1-LIKE 5 n=1 Tax=Dichanthelium oligosanthes TaxID=888268 RepID=A0A1E5VDF0_9POAL|nr:Protein SMAX1-LIKE 5 [Dichanthelium oligosanthes]
MRAGGYTVHQSLTAEAATVLKLSLGLARRRGHAQVTPLHVAYTLLGDSASSSSSPPLFANANATPAYGILSRACAKSHPGGASCASSRYSHPAQCRALELCFNVALNRLPTANAVVGSPLSSPSSSSASSTSFAASILHQPSPTLSNALVAALKRAQANQRRGCVELHAQQPTSPPGPPSTSPQQQQPMLTIKVELDQLIISILDDPSVSRVMKEAGFSSAAVKTNLEESAAMLLGPSHHHHHSTSTPSPAPPAAVPPQAFLEHYGGFPSGCGEGRASWPAPFLNYQEPDVGFESPCKEEDVMAILEVMSRKQGRRTNPVVVGDSVSVAEASVAELLRRLERSNVPAELRGARVLRLHLSHVHVRHMTRADVDACVADLRRTVAVTATINTKTGGLVIYVGDMRWAVDDNVEARAQAASGGFSPAEHLAAELAGLLGELRAASLGRRAWLVAAASYRTYMRCQQRSSLEATWALQLVAVPAGTGTSTGTDNGLGLGLALGPRAATRETVRKVAQLAQFPLLDFSPREEDGVPVLCIECARNYETEASAVRAKAEGTNLALTFFPGWPQADEPQTSHKDGLTELKRKWSRLCRRVHLQHNKPTRPSNGTTSSDPGLCLSLGTSEIKHQDVKTTLSLLPPAASAEASDEVRCHSTEDMDAKQATQQGSDTMVGSTDMKNVLRLWIDELPSGDRKRKAENVQVPWESKRWRGSCGLDLNLCDDDDEVQDGCSASSEDELVPSDLTNDGAASGDVTDSLDNHC